MEKIIIAAVAKNNVIGYKESIPWQISEDLKRFKQLTLNHYIIMGRKTYESILEKIGRPLPKRTNIVVSRKKEINDNRIILCNSIKEALSVAQDKNEKLVYIIGGAEIFRQTMPLTNRLEITEVNRNYHGDTFFPEIDRLLWEETFRKNMDSYSFVSYLRR